MKLVIQRVLNADVLVDQEKISGIGPGLLVLVGIGVNDSQSDLEYLLKKLLKLRIFSDNEGKMNKSLLDVNGELLLVSQFTLFADMRKGNRPSFLESARPEIAKPLFDQFAEKCRSIMGKNQVRVGRFGADMKVSLINDGPVTILLNSKE